MLGLKVFSTKYNSTPELLRLGYGRKLRLSDHFADYEQIYFYGSIQTLGILCILFWRWNPKTLKIEILKFQQRSIILL